MIIVLGVAFKLHVVTLSTITLSILPACLRIFTLKSDNILFVGFLLCQIQLAEHEHELIEMNSNSDKLQQSYNELQEFKIVLQKVFFSLDIFW